MQMEIWAVMATGKDGNEIPIACSMTEEGAYDTAREAVETASLMVHSGLFNDEQIEDAEATFNSVRVCRATLSVHG